MKAAWLLLCCCAMPFAVGCKGSKASVSQEPRATTQPTVPSGENGLTAKVKEEYKATNLPLQAAFSVKQGGGIFSEVGNDGKVKTTCSGLTVYKTLSLHKHIIPLKTNAVTSDCKIETTDYGVLQVDMQGGTYAGILVTPTQEEQLGKLAQQ
jgi:hypothetical protein